MMRVIADPAEADLYHREGLLYYRIHGEGFALHWIPDNPLHNPPSGLLTDESIPPGTWEFAIQLEE